MQMPIPPIPPARTQPVPTSLGVANPSHRWPSWRRITLAALALLVLNLLLSLENWWPTIAVKPDTRIAPELVLIWTALLGAAAFGWRLSRKAIGLLALAYVVLAVGRYAEVTVPALFGRPLNLYWDGQELPAILSTLATGLPWWQPLLAIAIIVAAAALLLRIVHWAWRLLVIEVLPPMSRSLTAWVLSIALLAVVGANYAGVQATWPYIAKPVLPTYLRQINLLATALSSSRLESALPSSPAFDSDLEALQGADVKLWFLESYGAMAFDNPAVSGRLAPDRQALAQAIEASGRQVLSAFVTSPTFAGGSELAHLGLLLGSGSDRSAAPGSAAHH